MVYFAKWKIILVLAISALGVLFAAPNFVPRDVAERLPDWLPHKQINLGLDLRGGAHLLWEVDVDSVIAEQLDTLVDGVRTELRKARIRYSGLAADGMSVGVTIKDTDRLDEAFSLLRGLDGDTDAVRDGPRIVLTLKEKAIQERRQAAVHQSIEIVRRRIDETGVREPNIQRQGDDRILLQLPGIDDPERIKSLIGKTAKMTFHLVDERASGTSGAVPPGSMLLESANPTDRGIDGRPRKWLIKKRVVLSGDRLVDAQPSFDSRSSEPIVNFRFDTTGARVFGKITQENVGKPFAIVLDGKVVSAPVIREPILGGSGQISGSFSVAEAQDLALVLRAGALPAPLHVLEERTVGPGLGADSVAAGETASIVGMIAVIVFMAIYYGLFGLMADVALAVNLLLIIALLTVLQATLTLPGIAGIALTIGMAVDANVLIFERIREETRAGRPPISAIDAGYARAMRTIIDANLTTLIAAVLLYQFGTGPVRGFAVTLAIGILTSMFTAVMLTRLMVVTWLRRTRPQSL